MNLTEFQESAHADEPHFLLFGNPVEHSMSPLMHNTAARELDMDVRYHAIALRVDELETVGAHLNRENFLGANVTIPYKHMLMEYVDELSIVAQNIGAINTIIKRDQQLIGDNTDIYGFSVPLQDHSEVLEGSKAVVFGTGGATKAIVQALFDFSVDEIVLISRDPDERKGFKNIEDVYIGAYDAWPAHAEEAVLIVNATPLGMAPQTDTSPVREAEQRLLEGTICYDIVYNPPKTKFLKMAESAGAITIGGLEMLIHQGSKSFELWTGQTFPIEIVRKALYEKISE